MAFEIQTLRGDEPMANMIADRRLYLTADRGRVVEHGDPDAAFLLAGEGSPVPVDEVERLGLYVEDGRVVYPDGPEAADKEQAEESSGVTVEKSGSWYSIYQDGELVDKVQGADARDELLAELEG